MMNLLAMLMFGLLVAIFAWKDLMAGLLLLSIIIIVVMLGFRWFSRRAEKE